MGKISQLHLFLATAYTCRKYINCGKNIELSISKTSDLKNSIYKIKETKMRPFLYIQLKSKYWEFSMNSFFFFLWIVQTGTQYFLGESRKFYCLFKIMSFWVTSRIFKKVLNNIVLTYSYGMFLLFCCDKLYCIRRVRPCSFRMNCAWYNKITNIIFFMSSFW